MHAYGLIKAAEVELDDKTKVKLLRIRNPWYDVAEQEAVETSD